jgi:hypothetical protein
VVVLFNAKTKGEFISQDEVKYVIDQVTKAEYWERSNIEFWDNRVMNIGTSYSIDKELGDFLKTTAFRIKDFIQKEYMLLDEVYPDVMTINRWFPGMEQPPHADDMTNTEVKGLEGRVFGSIIYLNTDYEGGKTYYPDYKIEITPEVGKLAVHPGNVEHLHGVTKVEGNTRYTLSSFWIYDEERSIDWSLYK